VLDVTRDPPCVVVDRGYAELVVAHHEARVRHQEREVVKAEIAEWLRTLANFPCASPRNTPKGEAQLRRLLVDCAEHVEKSFPTRNERQRRAQESMGGRKKR